MKKTICRILLLLLVLSLFLLTGCSLKKQPEVLKSFPKETAPSQVVKTDDRWVLLNSTYGGDDYTISVGENLDSLNDIYAADDVSIWYFEANETGIVWCEKTEEFYTYKVYAFETQKVEVLSQVPAAEEYQPQNVEIFHNTCYYCTIDYQQQKVYVRAYDIESKNTTDVYTAAFVEENQPYGICAEDAYLSFFCTGQITVLNLENNEIVMDSLLPSVVKRVFCVSYDCKNNTFALYYADADSEDIGIWKEGDSEIVSLFTFNENRYAYRDKIECCDGHIYWITQSNISGMVADHYLLVDYDYLNHKPVETTRTFDFCRDEDGLHILRFNKKEYTHIDLCQY